MRARRTLLFLLFACFPLSRPAQARMNLPQTRQEIRLNAAARTAARDYFAPPHAAATGELPLPLEQALIASLPENFRQACGRLLESWAGARGRGAAEWTLRRLAQDGPRVWLAVRCGSREQTEDMARYRDERLALLRADSGSLELLPLDSEAEQFEGVYTLAFVRRVALENSAGWAFRVTVEDNPCCDGPESRREERLMILAGSPRGVVESLRLVTARDDSSHSDDPDIDTETLYHADWQFEPGGREPTAFLVVHFQERVVETTWESGHAQPVVASQRSGTRRYRWNSKTFKYAEVR